MCCDMGMVVYEAPWARERRARMASERAAQELADLREQVDSARRYLARLDARLKRMEAQSRCIDVTAVPGPERRRPWLRSLP